MRQFPHPIACRSGYLRPPLSVPSSARAGQGAAGRGPAPPLQRQGSISALRSAPRPAPGLSWGVDIPVSQRASHISRQHLQLMFASCWRHRLPIGIDVLQFPACRRRKVVNNTFFKATHSLKNAFREMQTIL